MDYKEQAAYLKRRSRRQFEDADEDAMYQAAQSIMELLDRAEAAEDRCKRLEEARERGPTKPRTNGRAVARSWRRALRPPRRWSRSTKIPSSQVIGIGRKRRRGRGTRLYLTSKPSWHMET